jgi:peptide/nickel transport system ATP-binding protein
MYAGRVVEDGRASAVFAAPLHPYTAGLLLSVPSIESDELPRGMEGQLPSVGARSVGCAFAPRCALAEERCWTDAPPIVTVPQSEHTSRCFRWNEVGTGGALDRTAATLVPRPRRVLPETPMLAVTELRARYGEREIVHGVDIEIAKGECGAIVGSSGSGKTTIARCVVGLKPWASGSILLGGEPLSPDLAKRSREAIRRVQYVFQNPYNSLNPRKTVEQLLNQPLRLLRPELSRPGRRDAVREALDDVALGPGYLHRYPSQLSGGESQRVAIARALVSGPDLLVCDEVTSSLDVSVQASIIQLLDKLRQERGLTTVFITHDLALVRSLAQHVVLLHDGRVVEQGATAQLLEKPETLYAAQFFADHPRTAVLVPSEKLHAS